ncbi:hypothetical protein QTP81_15715 [Alteromonas sp. ASW11-36]|uniref:2TM domain-containing protein n=1 Tax=Alteromonas arenosi TaxID=3055817 RepID=A0ABT7T0W5_9ALTE|nr:hypothetical protein [Alteromonas sp. ASW11-36]MDM7862051.1 hypothetical protein [Alteromonas sp. ASW11-36]
MSFRNRLYRAGQNPKRSWLQFRLGMVIFVVGVLLLIASQRYLVALYWPAVGVVLSGFVVSMRGYWGIFANRFARVLEQRDANQINDPFADD